MPETVTVTTKSAWASKINWAQAIGVLASIAVIFGIDVPEDVKVGLVAAINGAMGVITWVMRTWFTKQPTASAIK